MKHLIVVNKQKSHFKRKERYNMLKDLIYQTTKPSEIYSMIAQINGIDLSSENAYFEHYATGVYRHDGYIFNFFDGFINERCVNKVVDKLVRNGVCDNYGQVLEERKDILNNPNIRTMLLGCVQLIIIKQPSDGGWRWHKCGKYIGNQNPEHEYLYNDTHIDKVYCYHIMKLIRK